MNPPLLGAVPVPLPRSRFITVIGWIVAAASVLVLPFSVISFMMVLVGSEGTAHMDPLDGLVVIAGPPVTLLAGIGLVRRWRWAWVYLLLVLAGFVGRSVNEIIEGPTPEQNYTSADGVRHTISATEVNYSFHIFVIAVAVGLFVFLLSRNARREFRIGGRQPLASGNATAVGAGVGSQNVSGPRIQHPDGVPPRVSRPAVINPVQRKQSLALLLAIVGLLAFAGVMFWLVQSGMKKGETALPSKRPSQRRIVARVDEPALYWVSVGLYATLGSGTLGLAVWGIRFALKEGQGGRR